MVVCTSRLPHSTDARLVKLRNTASTLQILFAGGVEASLSPLAAASLLVFSLLYTPCIAAVASVKRELGAKWAATLVVWQCVLAWIFAFIVKLIGGLV